MNQERRKEVQRALDLISEAQAIVEMAQSEEQEYFDNMPENLQNGDRGQKASESADALQAALDSMTEAQGQLEEAIS